MVRHFRENTYKDKYKIEDWIRGAAASRSRRDKTGRKFLHAVTRTSSQAGMAC